MGFIKIAVVGLSLLPGPAFVNIDTIEAVYLYGATTQVLLRDGTKFFTTDTPDALYQRIKDAKSIH